jgi:DNA-directed RNA polymerase II subunit RPB2
MLAHNADGDSIVKARVSLLRKPEIGDKFASRYSQKGTTGILYTAINMPFTNDGLVPDMIMNPHGIPSRMTVGKLLETMLGRIACNTGVMQDATPFLAYNFDSFRQSLKDYGMDEYGNEVMYNGQTGQMFDTAFFYGPTYYQRLKHMVEDKVHSRESGPVQLLTRQPAEGRSRDGGLRLGEMERDCFIAHGIPKFLKERFMDSSDLFKAYVSKKEESLIVCNPEHNLYKFNGQHIKNDEVMQVQLPYAMKLLLQELESMGLDVRMQVQ